MIEVIDKEVTLTISSTSIYNADFFGEVVKEIGVTYDPTQLDDMEMLSLIARGLIPYLEQVVAGEKNPFPYPEALLRGFNQLYLACALRDVARRQRPASIPEFVAQWGPLPLLEWPVKLNVPVDFFTVDDRLIDAELDGSPTGLCQKLSQGKWLGIF